MRQTLVGIAAIAAGCSSETGPTSPDGGSMGDGTIDPSDSAFLVTLEDHTDPNRPIRVDLVGENLAIDVDEETISVDVSVVNRGADPLVAPVLVRIGAFRPATVTLLNPDVVEIPGPRPPSGPPPLPYGFDYSDHLGDDGVLDTGEASGPKTWVFHDPGLGAFSFAARVDSGTEPTLRPYVGGVVYHDANRNGRRDRDEGPGMGAVEVAGPNGTGGIGFVGSSGRWFVPVEVPGLHRVRYFDPTDGPQEWIATTPNPIEVVLPPDPKGDPLSFGDADFGVALRRFGSDPVPVVMTERRPDEIAQDPYRLIEVALRGDVLVLHVQYSGGCRPDHPLVLYASGDFRESNPVQTWMLLAHDDLGDPCEAIIDRNVVFDLDPVRQSYVDAYGEPGVVILHFLDFMGNRHTFEFGP
jgi:hypothetical protein